MLTLEWLDGTQLADVDTLPLTLEERRDLAYLIAETWMTMIFRHGFFHGDPHPANILVLREAGTIGLVDFGAVGKLTDDDMAKLTRLFIDAASENVDVAARAARRLWASAIRRIARRSSSRSCASSSTATTARALARSIRSR